MKGGNNRTPETKRKILNYYSMQMNYNYLEIPFLMYQNSKTQMFDNILC